MNNKINHVCMFKELTDSQWNMLKPHLPKHATTSRPRSDDRTTINAIIFVLITGCRWIDLPVQYGSKSSAHRRFQDLQQKGIWKKILKCAIKSAYKQNKIKLHNISVDSSSIHSKKGAT